MMGQIAPIDSDRLAKRILAHHSFPGASHAAIERVLAKGDCKQLPHGSVLCREGEPGKDLYFLVRGNITVLRKDGNGEDRILSDMTCPCVFGHMSVIDGSRRSATCRANGPVEFVTLTRAQIDILLAEGSVAGVALRRLLIASLCDQLSSANGFVRKLVQDNSEAPPQARHKTSGTAPEPHGADEDLRKLTAKLGGWDSSLSELEEMEKDVEFYMDEDTRRNLKATGKKP
jgi:CRP/FNR family cyclic AMP-dependent transcriptional regulator